VFYSYLGWLPFGGVMSDMTTYLYPVERVTGFPLLDAALTGNWVAFKDQVWHLIMPSIVLAAGSLSSIMRLTRTSMIEILHEDYITAARSYGLTERLVLWRYALKNSMGPTATAVALLTAYLIVNTFLIEALFTWPGIGRYISLAVVTLDFPVILGVAIIASISFVVLNTLADLVVALDPRVRTR
jgi:peptide/nickel transport system permease protein